ncbi:WD40-repeat-containing domain protein [Dactylonectria estremocensis]|uniref:WD40-repeat-containing domain protein n=1 Tax=Dactylonectria estremocensis TaxID=1079267 RepID=A0A9P9F0Y2_9HYPO|nr:WD40-repeat-containing domain protein [Dactylonectria estremocensis]
MDAFSPVHGTDEGYSEDPLNPTVHNDLASALASLRSPADLPAWLAANISLLPVQTRTNLTMSLLDRLPTSVIAEIVQRLNPRLYIDFIRYLPAEICLKILGYLDPVSLVSVTQTCRAWYDLALDRKLWETLYHLEGWKAIYNEIETCEIKVNNGLNVSIRQLHRVQSRQDAHPSKIRAIVNGEEDLEMPDSDRTLSFSESFAGGSIFGSPSSSFASHRPVVLPLGEMDLDGASSKSKEVDRSNTTSSSDSKGKRKERGGESDFTPPPTSSTEALGTMPPSLLWIWDVNSCRYRVNWRYLYTMRRRLESNWELGKFNTFQFPHPNFPEEGHQECVYTLQFDNDYLVSGSRDQTMRIWNVNTRRLVRPPLTGHMGSVLCLQFDAHPDEDLLVSGSSDSNVFIWQFSTGKLIQKLTRAHRESVLNVRFDHRILVTSSKDKTIKIFNRRPLRHGDLGYGGNELVNPVPTNLRRYGYEPDLAQELPVKPAFSLIGRLDGHSAAVNAIQVRDRTIVSVSGDRHIKVWNWPEQVCTQTIPAHDKGIACVEFDGRRIVSGSSDFEVCIFDAPTGLKVAQLRGHAHLVRTVQAGFGDLPYSKYEDEAEAKAVDAEYFRAVESGELKHDFDRRRRRARQPNAGSSRPEDLQAFGAKVPPGGGGGRKYGRIVSGSYDQSIIVWRRDKEGVWKPAHHLRQEEAAAAAQRETNVPVGNRDPASLAVDAANTAHAVAHALNQDVPDSFRGHIPFPKRSEASGSSAAPASLRDQHGDAYRTSGSYRDMIDQIVPLGPVSLRQALLRYPVILAHHSYLQSTIEREVSPFVRAKLRKAVTDALIRIQLHEVAMREQAAAVQAAAVQAAAAQAAPTQVATNQTAIPQTAAPQAATTQPPVVANVQAQGAPPTAPAQGAQGQNVAAPPATGHAHHHPHIAAAENAPARVFKLQFDVRKIVCCSQAPVIVGWDFCNKEPELEAAVRFFATVD